MEYPVNRSPQISALKIAGMYAVIGLLWILFSDRFVANLATSEGQLTTLQTIKGWAFVISSAALIHWMILIEQRRLIATHEEVETALQQVHILHRILRHNLRNICSIIGGTIDRVNTHSDMQITDSANVLSRQNERLINLSEKSRYLRDFLSENVSEPGEHDLVELVDIAVMEARHQYDAASIHVESPPVAPVYAHHLIDGAIEELIENAIEHNQSANPTVWLTVQRGGNPVTLAVEDNGPGIPSSEKATLQRRFETSLEHSQGLGLWLVHLTIQASQGELFFEEGDHGGSVVKVRLSAAND